MGTTAGGKGLSARLATAPARASSARRASLRERQFAIEEETELDFWANRM